MSSSARLCQTTVSNQQRLWVFVSPLRVRLLCSLFLSPCLCPSSSPPIFTRFSLFWFWNFFLAFGSHFIASAVFLSCASFIILKLLVSLLRGLPHGSMPQLSSCFQFLILLQLPSDPERVLSGWRQLLSSRRAGRPAFLSSVSRPVVPSSALSTAVHPSILILLLYFLLSFGITFGYLVFWYWYELFIRALSCLLRCDLSQRSPR